MIENQFQLENTRAKQLELQRLFEQKFNETDSEHSNAYVRELTLRSLKRRINRMTEEMARYESQRVSKPASR